jgi:SAM-dependent methyltransferase
LRQGTARVSRLGLSDRVHVLEGDLSEGLDVPAADLVWAARVVHHLSDPVAGLVELGRLTSPGGLLAVIEGGLPIRVLPGGYGVGRPGFMSRLEAVLSDHFIDAYDLPERVTSGTEDWPLLMAEAGWSISRAAPSSWICRRRSNRGCGRIYSTSSPTSGTWSARSSIHQTLRL